MKKFLLPFLLFCGCLAIRPVASQTPYITKVIEFKPAPGQFTNELPEYEEGDTEETMRAKAEEYLADNNKNMVSLGGYGGYIVVGFDHTIVNVPGQFDFKVLGNAFYANDNPRPDAPLGGSCEPGIIMVAYDANKNGKPDDDEWYEIAGSEYHKDETLKEYSITYYRPDSNHVATPSESNKYLNDTTYIRWQDNRGNNGYISRNTFHRQSYFPEWIDSDSITFSGTKLANNGIDESGNGSYYVLYAYGYGYADNHPNTDTLSNIKIDWAVDRNGNPVYLPGVDFIKIYTGVNQYNGWLGECSTEVLGVEDLHIDAEMSHVETLEADCRAFYPNPVQHNLTVELNREQSIEIISTKGDVILRKNGRPGANHINMTSYPAGIYLLRTGHEIHKIIKSFQ